MTDENTTAGERYREKSTRVSIWESEYEKAQLYLIQSDDFDYTIADKPNRVIAETFMFAIGNDDDDGQWLDRLNKFADRNDMTKNDAINEIVRTVLDDSGHIEETFRKPRLFSNDMW